MTRRDAIVCDECAGPCLAERRAMQGLCVECAHWIYGYPACQHRFVEGSCALCGWNGAVSDFVAALKRQV